MSVAVGPAFVHRRILGATAAVTIGAAIGKAAALVKEFVVAGAYGRSDAFEAFVLAALIPGLLVNLISESMNQALVPTLVRVREREGREAAQRLLSNCLLSSTLLLTTASVAMAASARLLFPVFGSHYSHAKLELAIELFYCLLPVIVLAGLASTYAAVLNTEGEFCIPAVAPIVTSAATIGCVYLFSRNTGIWAMVYGSVAGALGHSVWLGMLMGRRGYTSGLRWYGRNDATREVARQYGPVFLSSIVASAGLLVDQSMAAMLAPGSVSALVYAGRFVSVALALLGGTVATAVTPTIAELVAHGRWAACRRTLHLWSWASGAAAGGVALVLMLGAHSIVRLTFQHGMFGAQDTSVVASVLVMYAIQVPFFVSSRVFYRFLIAMRRTDLVFYCGALNLLLDVVLNLVLMGFFGIAGIALATSLWSVSTFAFLCYWSWRVLPRAADDFASREG